MNCVLIEHAQLTGNGLAVLDERQSRHVTGVLKKQAGDTLLAGVIDGPLGPSKITAAEPGRVVIERPEGEIPPRPDRHLILAMPRPKVMKRLWAPIASLGAGSITVIGAARVESCYFDSHALDESLYRARLIEGLEQAKDTRLPEVRVFKSFTWFARQHLPGFDTVPARIVLHPGAARPLADADVPGPSVIAIGPEGGWSPDERETFIRHGFIEAGLGPRILRTDTAVIAALIRPSGTPPHP